MAIDVFVEFLGTIGGLKAAIDEADAEMTRLSRSGASAMTKVEAASKAAVLGVGLAAVGVGAMAVTAAASFQKSMEQIHTQAGVAQDQVDKLAKGVLNLAPQVGTGPDELSVALYHVESTLSSSLSAADRYRIAMQQVKIAAEGAKVGNANLEDVTNALNATMASGMVPIGDMSKAMGALNAIVGAGDMHMQDLSDALGTGVLAVVKGYGVGLNDVGAALATFGDNNIRGADAATALRTAVQALAVPAKGGAKALADIGLSAGQLGKDMQTGGLNKALTDLHDRLVATGNDGDKAGELLTAAFGKKAGVGLQVLEEQFSRFQQKEKEVADGANGFDDAWQSTTKTFAFQFDQLKATVEELAIKLGTLLIPYVEKAALAIADAVKWLTKHKAVAEALGVALGTVLVGALAVATAAMIEFTVALVTDPVFLIVAAIALLGVGIFELVTHWSTVWAEIKKIVGDAWHWIDSNIFQPIGNFFVGTWRSVLSTAQSVWSVAWKVIRVAIEPFVLQFQITRDVIVTAWHLMDAAFEFVANHWQTIVKVILAVVLGPLGLAIDALWTHWNAVWGFIKAVTDAVWSFLRDTVFKPLYEFLQTTIVGAVTTLRNAFEASWNGIKAIAQAAWQFIYNGWGKYLLVFLGPAGWLALGVIELQKHWSTVWGAIKDATSAVWNFLHDDIFVPLQDFFVNVITNALDGMQLAFTTVWNAIETVVKSVWKAIEPILDTMKRAIDDTVGAVGKVASVAGTVAGGVGKVVGGVGKFFGFASGTDYAPGGLAIVGENGPELVNLPRGSQVVPNNLTMRLLSSGNEAAQLSSHHAATRREAAARQAQHDETNALLADIRTALRSMPRQMQTLSRTA